MSVGRPLTGVALARHVELEAIVEHGLETFVEVGLALDGATPEEISAAACRMGLTPDRLCELVALARSLA